MSDEPIGHAPSGFAAESEVAGDRTFVRFTGEFDIGAADRAEAELAAIESRAPELVVLDLRELEFMDSTGLRVILAARRRAEARAGRLVIVRGPEPVDRVFRLARLERFLEFVDEPSEA